MNDKPLKLGFLGGSLDSAVGTTHVLASQLDRRWTLETACFSHQSEINHQTASHWGLAPERVHDHWKDLLDSEAATIDAVAILTPTPLHVEMAIAALERGLPVICEKSVSTTLEEARRLEDVVQECDGFLAVIYNYTGYPMLREVRARVQSGSIGDITQIHVEMPQEGYLKLDQNDHELVPQEWRLADGPIPTLHLDLGVHVENLIYFLTERHAERVLAINNSYGHFDGIVDNTLCVARYPDNVDGNIWFGKSALGYSNGLRVRIFGTSGAMEWHQLEPDQCLLHDNHGSTRVVDARTSDLLVAAQGRYNRFKPGHPMGFIEAFANYYADLADAVTAHQSGTTHDSPFVFTITDAVAGMAMLDAMQRSAQEGRWVTDAGA